VRRVREILIKLGAELKSDNIYELAQKRIPGCRAAMIQSGA
jgi:hypothetical protein